MSAKSDAVADRSSDRDLDEHHAHDREVARPHRLDRREVTQVLQHEGDVVAATELVSGAQRPVIALAGLLDSFQMLGEIRREVADQRDILDRLDIARSDLGGWSVRATLPCHRDGRP